MSVGTYLPRRGSGRKQLVLIAPAQLAMLRSLLSGIACEIEVIRDGQALLDGVRRRSPDLVLAGADLGSVSGFEVCAAIKEAPASQGVSVILILPRSDPEDHVRAVEAGADDVLTTPISHIELRARVRSLLRLKAMRDGLDGSDRVIFGLAAAVEVKEGYSEAHPERVALTARLLGERLGLAGADLDTLYCGGRVHDVGKVCVPEATLLKRGPLDPDELATIRSHVLVGEEMVRPLRGGSGLREIVRHHHERYDGSGYPDRLAGQEIPLLARIMAVCDAYEAMVSDRPYRKARSSTEAIAVLRRGAGRQWDRELVAVFTELVVPFHRRLLRAG